MMLSEKGKSVRKRKDKSIDRERIFVDAHIHMALDGRDFRNSRIENQKPVVIRKLLQEYKKKGIYLLRDGGDNLNISLQAREIALEEGMILRTPGYAIYKKGAYGSFLGRPVSDRTDFKEAYQELVALKADHLKIILTGLIDFHEFGKVDGIAFGSEELFYMTQSAKEHELPVMVHANSAEAVRMAVKAGADTIEHGYYLTEEELHLMAEHGTIWLPTLSPLGNLLTGNAVRYNAQIPTITRIYESQKENVQKAYQIGVKMAIGSDAGSNGVYHGQGFFDEMSHFMQAGLSEDEVKKTVCDNGLEALRIRDDELDNVCKAITEDRGTYEDNHNLL